MAIESGWVEGDGARRRGLAAADFRAEPHALAGEGTLVSLRLARPLAPGASLRLGLRYAIRLPERYGWGCTDGGCLLPGGYHPMLAALDAGGFDLDAPPARGAVDVALAVTRPAALVLGDQWSGNGARALRVRAEGVPYLPLVVAPGLHERRRRAAGATVRLLAREPPPPGDDAVGQPLPYTFEDRGDAALDTALAAQALLARWSGRPPRSLTIVEVPLRTELASAQPGAVHLSDRFFRLWPAERFRKFHRRQLVRAVVAAGVAPRLAAAGADLAAVERASEVVAAHLSELYVLETYARKEYLNQILRPVSFVPAVDQLLYAPQTLFADAFFGGDADGWRDDVRRFAAAEPRGRVLYDKLRDLLPPAALDRALRRVATDGVPLAAAAADAHGAPLDDVFRQWRKPPGRANLRLAGFDSAPRRGPGPAGAAFVGEVRVVREVAPGDRPPIEPVDVLVVDDDGGEHRGRWDGRGAGGTVRFALPAPIARVTLDPDGRLTERKIPGDAADVRFDNVSRHGKRFVYYGLGVQMNLSDLSLLLAADFRLSRVHDLQNSMRFLAYQSASTTLGARAAYRRNFGPEVTPDRLVGQAGLSLGVARLRSDYFAESGDDARPSTALSLSASVGGDTEVFVFEPIDKDVLAAVASATAYRRDAGATSEADVLVAGAIGLTAVKTFTPRLGHTLAGQATLDVAFGDLAGRAQLVEVGGADGVRGYASGARFARAVLLGRAEYRHAYVHDLDWNVGQYSFYRGFGGVAFADVGWATPCDSYAVTRDDGLVAALGYGFQMFYDNFGTLPSVLRLDAAVRLSGRGPACFGELPAPPPRLQVYLTFLPPF